MPTAPRRTCTGSPTCPVLLPAGTRYCPHHARQYEGRRGSTTARGYGMAHKMLRARWQRRIDSGEVVVCATCPARITGSAWQLGHDHERGGYLGPQCVRCNARDGGRRGRAAQGR